MLPTAVKTFETLKLAITSNGLIKYSGALRYSALLV